MEKKFSSKVINPQMSLFTAQLGPREHIWLHLPVRNIIKYNYHCRIWTGTSAHWKWTGLCRSSYI